MRRLQELEQRIGRALDRIEAALAAPGAAVEDAAEVEFLRAELERMRDERRRDAEDVTAILADLRPLLERG